MKKYKKFLLSKVLGLVVCTLILVATMSFSYATNGTGSVQYAYEPYIPADPATPIYSGKEITHRSTIENSGTNKENIYAEIKIPKDYVNYNSIKLANLVTNGTFELLPGNSDPNNYIGRLHISQIDSGTSIFPQFSYKMLTGVTPDNYSKTVSFQLKEEDGTPLGDALYVTNHYKTVKPTKTTKQIFDSRNWQSTVTPNKSIFAGVAQNGLIVPATAVDIRFRYLIWHDNSNNFGNRDYGKITVKDTLPQGAVFDQSKNPGWTYDAVTRVATYVFDKNISGQAFGYQTIKGIPISNNNNRNLELVLSFDNQSVTNPDGTRKKFTNDVELELEVDNPQPGETAIFSGTDDLKDDIDFYLNTDVKTRYSIFKNPEQNSYLDLESKLQDNVMWTINYVNQGDAVKNLVIKDYSLNPNLEFVGLKATSVSGKFGTTLTSNDGKFNVKLTLDDNSTVDAGIYDPYDNNAEILFDTLNIPANREVKLITLTSSDEAYVAWKGAYVRFGVLTKFKDPSATHVPPNADSVTYSNSVSSAGVHNDYGVQGDTVTRTGNIIVKAYKPSVELKKERFGQVPTHYGDQVNYQIKFLEEKYRQLIDGDIIKTSGNKLVDILPPGVNYVPGSASINYSHKQPDGTNDYIFVDKEPEVTFDSATDRYKLTWYYAKDINKFGDTLGNDTTTFYKISFKGEMTEFANSGNLNNTVMTIWDNNSSNPSQYQSGVVNHKGNVADTFDLDADGNTSEEIGYSDVSFVFNPPQEIRSFKEIQDTVNGGWSSYGTFINPKVDFKYNFTIRNTSGVSVSDIKLIDKIPYIGDTSIVEGTPRGSMFDVVMSPAQANIQIPAGYKVYYNPSTSATFDGGGWIEHSAVTDWTLMRVVKIESEPGTVIPPNSTLRFPIVVRTKEDNIEIGEGYLTEDILPKAYNDFAKNSGSGAFIDVNKVVAKYFYYNMSGTAFFDENNDNIFNDNEHTLNSIVVELLNSDGTPVLDENSSPVTTTTDENGVYKFKVYSSGTYRVKFNVSDYEVVTEGDIGDNNASHIGTDQVSKTFTFDTTKEGDTYVNSYYVVNGGYRGAKYTLSKELKDAQGNTITDEKDFTFNLAISNIANGGSPINNLVANIVNIITGESTEIMVSDGDNLIIRNGYKLVIPNLIEGIRIIATELNADDYNTEIDGSLSQDRVSDITTSTAQNSSVVFTNTERRLGELNITKTLLDANGNTINEEREFSVKITGPSYPAGQEFIFNNSVTGNINLTGLIYGDYTVEELNADDYDVTNGNETVTLSLDNKTANINIINKEKTLGSISVSKILLDADDNTINEVREFTIKVTGPSYPTGREFELKNGTDGNVSLTGLIYGEYTIEELNIDNYDVTTVSQTVNISVDAKVADLSITNKEKALGKLTINKSLVDASENEISEEKEFEITVTGPSYPDGEVMTITNGEPIVLEGLKYGTYSVVETEDGNYVTTQAENVTLSIDNREAALTIINMEGNLGSLIIDKKLVDSEGRIIEEGRDFEVTVTGPSFPEGKVLKVTSGTQMKLTGLEYGNYSVVERENEDYEITQPSEKTIDINNKQAEFVILNKEKPKGSVTITNTVVDDNGNEIEAGTEFEVTITGPSFPDGKVFVMTTGQDIEFNDLIFGEYSVVQTIHSKYKTTQALNKTIYVGKKHARFDIVNTKPAKKELPKTGTKTSIPNLLAGTLLILIGVSFFVKKEIRI